MLATMNLFERSCSFNIFLNIMSYLSIKDKIAAAAVCKTWNNIVVKTFTSFHLKRDTVNFYYAGSDNEVIRIFETFRFRNGGTPEYPYLHLVTLHKTPCMTNYLVDYMCSRYLNLKSAPNLTHLVLELEPIFPELATLSQLKHLKILLRRRFNSNTNYTWYIPDSGTLEFFHLELDDKFNKTFMTQPISIHYQYGQYRRINNAYQAFRNVKTLVILNGSLSGVDVSHLFPSLQCMKVQYPQNYGFPPTLETLNIVKLQSTNELPSLDKLTHLKTLVVNVKTFRACRQVRELLQNQTIHHLEIYVHDSSYRHLNDCFYEQLRSSPLGRNLRVLKIGNHTMSEHTLQLAQTKFKFSALKSTIKTAYDQKMTVFPPVHDEHTRVIRPCEYCGTSLEAHCIKDHYEVCSRSRRSCPLAYLGCRKAILNTSREYQKHMKKCSYNLLNCACCMKSIHISLYSAHMMMHDRALPFNELNSKTIKSCSAFKDVICIGCKQELEIDCLKKHLCPNRNSRKLVVFI
ncbi:uncharacterized protein LOC126316766 [Schistocerca gregaria]|uniref:uncharacterized protein LOC126316766 n=1 Tax=Schistocerca gregaria TaxID=7010 RepID=UPI00211F1069|nr:uncharacterized protein LOC126316766 [Schistocerca gregaria]